MFVVQLTSTRSPLTKLYMQDLCSFNVRSMIHEQSPLLIHISRIAEGAGARRLPEPRPNPHAGIQPRSAIGHSQAGGYGARADRQVSAPQVAIKVDFRARH